MDSALTPLSEIDLRSLSHSKDEGETCLSIYLNTVPKDDRRVVEARLKVIGKALPADLEKAFARTREMVEPMLDAYPIPGERSRIIFASPGESFARVYRLGIELEAVVVWDNSPFLLPLARLRKEYRDYALLLVDSQEARLFLVQSQVPEVMERRSVDLMNKHKKGGWSQMRFNRLRRGAIKSFLKEVVEDLQSLNPREMHGLVVAGPGQAKGQLLEMLPASWRELVLGVLDVSIHTSSGDLARLGDEISRGDRSREMDLVERLKEEVLRGGLAAYGSSQVRGALAAGRVNFLLLQNSFALPQMICRSCHFPGEGEICPACGGQTEALRLEELYELAESSGAEVVLVEDDAFLESVGGMGAILRY